MEPWTPEFEIFCDLGENLEPCEIASVNGLGNAMAMMRRVAAQIPGRYFVWNSSKDEVMARIDSAPMQDGSPILECGDVSAQTQD